MFSTLANARTNQTVVFIAPSRVGCGSTFEFYNCVKVGDISKSFGTPTDEHCPDEDNAGEFVVIETRLEGEESWSGSMVGVMPCGNRSVLRELIRSKCKNADLRINFTKCGSRSDINNFAQAFVFDNVTFSNYSATELGALNPSEIATITETVTFTFSDFLEVFPQTWSVLNEGGSTYVDITLCDSPDCDVLCTEDCLSVFGLREGLNEFLYDYTTDGGLTWQTVPNAEILTPSDFPGIDTLTCAQGNLVHVHNPTGSVEIWVNNYDTFIGGGAWTNTHTFTPTVGEARDVAVFGDTMYLALVGGDLIKTQVIGGTPTTSQPFGGDDVQSVFALSKTCVLAGGPDGQVAYSENSGASWNDITIPNVTVIINHLWAFDENEFLAIDFDGNLYCTGNGGRTWELVFTFPDRVVDMQFTHRTSGYVATIEGVYRSTDAGSTWVAQEGTFNTVDSGGSSGLEGEPTSMALCPSDTNLAFVGTDSGALYQGLGG